MPEGRRRRAVFLDRDGVLNEVVVDGSTLRPPSSLEEVRLCEGAVDALVDLRAAGYLLVMVTNQPDVARGGLAREVVDRINARLVDDLVIDAVYVCPHDGPDGCACRKPRPGMLTAAALDHGIDLAASWVVGDRWIDVAAGRTAGARTVLLERPWSWDATSTGAPPAALRADARCTTLPACVAHILDAVR